ncbi:MAG TPA: peptidoglycan-binding domain-containing protein [Candidatus Tectomicrobia bacterium]|nr:peptidoglycan-binding domain-containing protein [Candidatus Tectomicrobia bacterium]
MRRILMIGMAAALAVLPLTAGAQSMGPIPEGRTSEGSLIPEGAEPHRPSLEARSETSERTLVRDAQLALRDAGYDPGMIDGVMGSKTRAALREFQAVQGLPQTGRLDTTTQQQLFAAYTPESRERSGVGLAR